MSIGMIIPNIWENKINVPNHQPVFQSFCPDLSAVLAALEHLTRQAAPLSRTPSNEAAAASAEGLWEEAQV